MIGPGDGKGPIGAGNGRNGNHQFWRPLDLILMEINRSFDLSPKLGGLHMPIRRTHRVHTTKATTTRQLRSSPSLERADMHGNSAGVTRRCGLVGKSLDDEQWSDDLINPSSSR